MNLQIEKGIQIPKGKVLNPKYPFEEMEVGDSFLCDDRKVSGSCSNYGKRNNVKFTIRKVEDGIRVWRTA